MVKMSDKYIVRGSAVFSPSRNATVGATGVAMTSQASKAVRKSCRMRVRTFCALR